MSRSAAAAACAASSALPGRRPERPRLPSGRLARMDDQTLRYIDLTLADDGRYQATNRRGGVLPIGRGGDDTDFTPVELFLAAHGGLRRHRRRPDHRQAGHAPSRSTYAPRGTRSATSRATTWSASSSPSTSPSPRGRTATGPGSSCRAPWSRPATGSARSAAPSQVGEPHRVRRGLMARRRRAPAVGGGAAPGRAPVRGHRRHAAGSACRPPGSWPRSAPRSCSPCATREGRGGRRATCRAASRYAGSTWPTWRRCARSPTRSATVDVLVNNAGVMARARSRGPSTASRPSSPPTTSATSRWPTCCCRG